jgi:hypothetical protein
MANQRQRREPAGRLELALGLSAEEYVDLSHQILTVTGWDLKLFLSRFLRYIASYLARG